VAPAGSGAKPAARHLPGWTRVCMVGCLITFVAPLIRWHRGSKARGERANRLGTLVVPLLCAAGITRADHGMAVSGCRSALRSDGAWRALVVRPAASAGNRALLMGCSSACCCLLQLAPGFAGGRACRWAFRARAEPVGIRLRHGLLASPAGWHSTGVLSRPGSPRGREAAFLPPPAKRWWR